MEATAPKIVGPNDGDLGFLGSIGSRHMADGDETGGGFSLVEHPMPPGALAAPLHRHTREDEYSYVLEGRMGALLGDDVVVAETGDFVFKPRNQWHTFWNAGNEAERFFRELAALGGAGEAAPEQLAELSQRYGLEMQPESVPGLLERFGLRMAE